MMPQVQKGESRETERSRNICEVRLESTVVFYFLAWGWGTKPVPWGPAFAWCPCPGGLWSPRCRSRGRRRGPGTSCFRLNRWPELLTMWDSSAQWYLAGRGGSLVNYCDSQAQWYLTGRGGDSVHYRGSQAQWYLARKLLDYKEPAPQWYLSRGLWDRCQQRLNGTLRCNW